MTDYICSLPPHYHLAAIVIVQVIMMLIEAWLGKTDKVQSASVLELIWNLVKAIFRKP